MKGTEAPRRYAVLRQKADRLESVQRFMPSNYTARIIGPHVLVAGQDSAGWTLEGYVLPRLASGMFFGTEVKVADAWPAGWEVEGPEYDVGIFGTSVCHQECPRDDSDGDATLEEWTVGTRHDNGIEWVTTLHLLTCTVCGAEEFVLDDEFGGPIDAPAA